MTQFARQHSVAGVEGTDHHPTTIRRTYAVIDGYLADRAASWLADHVELRDVLRNEPHRGRASAAAWVNALFDTVIDGELTHVRLTVDAGRVAAEWILVGRDRVSDVSVRIPMVGIYDIANAQIVSGRLYYDPAAIPEVSRSQSRRASTA